MEKMIYLGTELKEACIYCRFILQQSPRIEDMDGDNNNSAVFYCVRGENECLCKSA